jgi:hypothetical protein
MDVAHGSYYLHLFCKLSGPHLMSCGLLRPQSCLSQPGWQRSRTTALVEHKALLVSWFRSPQLLIGTRRQISLPDGFETASPEDQGRDRIGLARKHPRSYRANEELRVDLIFIVRQQALTLPSLQSGCLVTRSCMSVALWSHWELLGVYAMVTTTGRHVHWCQRLESATVHHLNHHVEENGLAVWQHWQAACIWHYCTQQ